MQNERNHKITGFAAFSSRILFIDMSQNTLDASALEVVPGQVDEEALQAQEDHCHDDHENYHEPIICRARTITRTTLMAPQGLAVTVHTQMQHTDIHSWHESSSVCNLDSGAFDRYRSATVSGIFNGSTLQQPHGAVCPRYPGHLNGCYLHARVPGIRDHISNSRHGNHSDACSTGCA